MGFLEFDVNYVIKSLLVVMMEGDRADVTGLLNHLEVQLQLQDVVISKLQVSKVSLNPNSMFFIHLYLKQESTKKSN